MIKSSTARIITKSKEFFSKYKSLLTSCHMEVYPGSTFVDADSKITNIPVDLYVVDNQTGNFPYEKFIRKLNSDHTRKFLINVGLEPPKTIDIPLTVIQVNPGTDHIPISLFIENADKLIKREKAQLELSTMLLHDVRSPLNSLIGYLELLINGTFGCLNEGHKNIIEKAIDMGDNALDLLEDLHDVFREEQETLILQQQAFNFNKIIEAVLAIVWVKADNKNIQIRKDISKDLPEIHGDDFQIQRLLTNLITNAIKYSPKNSRIIIKARTENAKFIKVSVIDTGQGVSDEDLHHLFDKFFRVKQKNRFKKGYGLGLYICKIIITAHDGKIWAENNELGGLTVHFTIPYRK
jgi:signal transduction histidine kinase